jgi:integrase
VAYAEKVFKVRDGKQTKQYTWRARYKKPDGTWGSEPGFPTKVTAEAWGEEQEAAIRAGRWLDPSLARKHFGVWAREWMKAKGARRGKTVDGWWELLERVILPKWEHVPLMQINWFDVDAWAGQLQLSDARIDHSLTLMSSMLTGAVDAKHIATNPIFGRRRTGKGSPAAVKRKRKTKHEEMWAPPEIVIQLAQRMGPAKGLHILTTAFTGLRFGEGLGLHREDVLRTRVQSYRGGVFTCPILRVHQEYAEYTKRDEDGERIGLVKELEPLKNEFSVRDIDVPPFLARLLGHHLADWPHQLVFCQPNGGPWWAGNWARQLRPAADGRPERLKRQGASYRAAWAPIMRGLDLRALRHTHDTYQDQIGVRPALAHEQAGHRRPGIKGVYQHPTPAMRQERLDGLEAIYWEGMRSLGLKTLWDRVDLQKISQTAAEDEAEVAQEQVKAA